MRSSLYLGVVLLAVAGCRDKDSGGNGSDGGNEFPTFEPDNDGDGWAATDDCDDDNADVYPGAPELCNDIDDNCDAVVDEDVTSTFFRDGDGDGFGDPTDTTDACEAPVGYVADATDCDDGDDSSWPGAPEQCDSVDNDCDGDLDEGVIDTVYEDADGDGYGNQDVSLASCVIPDGYAGNSDDCDDTVATINPNGVEVCNGADDDCDGDLDEDDAVDAGTWWGDADGDGYGDVTISAIACDAPEGFVANPDDCDDAADGVFPGAAEVCNGIDDDCDSVVDLVDDDADGFISGECGGPDCDDSSADINPSATETWYDGIDSNCDAADDYDADSDGFTALSAGGTDCDDAASGVYPGATDAWYDGIDADCAGDSDYDADGDGHDWSAFSGDDCDDTDAAVSPSASETWYDGTDADCAGDNDFDADADGFLSDSYGGTDCDDAEAAVFPGATDTWYDGTDSDCSGDDDYDADGDGFQSDAYGGTDCDDATATTFPGATETWYDDVDADCAGDDDYDADGDGFQSDSFGGTDCDDFTSTTNPSATDTWYDGVDSDCAGDDDYDIDGDGHQAIFIGGDDCDDYDATISPSATETWYDGIDSDCSGGSDVDADGDGFTAISAGGTDCDDAEATTYPGATDTWYDGVDSDCAADNDFDADLDGFDIDTFGGTDCDDAEATTFPGATDTWYDGVDSDCAGDSDYDFDGDGHDSDLYGGDDCADLNASRSPSAIEVWYDGTDQDCAGDDDYDADGDGYPHVSYLADTSLTNPADCWDEEAGMNAGATEVADDGLDNDCDGVALRGTVAGGVSVDNADLTFTGSVANDRLAQGDPGFGWAGDMNNDGIDDFVVGAILDDTAGSQAGAAYIVFGSASPGSGGDITANADVILTGEAAGDYAGRTVAGLGDVDGDGFDDLAINSLNEDSGGSNSGAVYVMLGPITTNDSLANADTKFIGDAASDIFAEATFTGDIDGDGKNDMVVGAQFWDGGGDKSGGVFLFSGPMSVSGAGSTVGTVITGETAGDEAGSAMGSGGDFDGDGYNDMIIGALRSDYAGTDAGSAYLVTGPVTADMNLSASDYRWDGFEDDDQIGGGVSVAFAGDTNGDGLDDLIIGGQYDDTVANKAGAAYIILGTSGTLTGGLGDADAILYSVAEKDRTGDSVGPAGDVDGDGNADVIVGSGYSDYSSLDGGMIYVATGPFSGTSSLQDAYFAAWATNDGDRSRGFGVGDIDNDGLDDVGLGAMLNDNAASNAGALFLFLGGNM